ncbi:MAG: hypothetical protein WDO13_11130 [Verrucomicrobiota bacterium]
MHQIKADSTRGAGVYLKAGVLLGLTALTLLICFLTPPGKAGGEAGVDMNGLPYQVGPVDGPIPRTSPRPSTTSCPRTPPSRARPMA